MREMMRGALKAAARQQHIWWGVWWGVSIDDRKGIRFEQAGNQNGVAQSAAMNFTRASLRGRSHK